MEKQAKKNISWAMKSNVTLGYPDGQQFIDCLQNILFEINASFAGEKSRRDFL